MVVKRKVKLLQQSESEGKGSYRVRSKESSFGESKEVLSKPRPPPYSAFNSEGVDIMFWVAVFLSQVAGLTSVVLIAYWCTLYGGFAWNSNAGLQFFFHPLLMVLGLIFFYGDAIIVYRVLHFLPKWILKIVHAALHITAIIMSSVGLAAVFENHRRTNKADLYSLHSWVGIATFGFFCLQYVASFVTFMVPAIPLSLRAKVLPYHTFFGLVLFIMAVGTAEMGLTERLLWTENYSSGKYVKAGTVGNCAGLFLVIFAILVAYLTTTSKYKRRPLPSESTVPTN